MSKNSAVLYSNLLYGAVSGLSVWGAYAILEYIGISLIPLLRLEQATLPEMHGRLTVLLFGAYILLGLVAGTLCGWLNALLPAESGAKSRSRLALMNSMLLALVFAGNLVSEIPLSGAEYISLAIALSVSAILIISFWASSWRDRLAWLEGPWVIGPLLLGPAYLGKNDLRDTPSTIKLIAICGYVAIVGGSAWIYSGIAHRRRGVGQNEPALSKRVAGLILVMALVPLGCGTLWNRGFSGTLPVAPGSGAAPKHKPNIVLITMDTVRADHLSLYGYKRDTTPNLRKLAGAARVYTNAVSAGDMTLASHASIFTGLYPSWHGAHYAPPENPSGRPLAARFRTMAEQLAAQGYFTMAVVANAAYLQPALGMAQGFQLYNCQTVVGTTDVDQQFYLRRMTRALLGVFLSTAEFDRATRSAEEINRDAFQLLNEVRHSGQAFFLFLNYMDAHTPYLPPAPFDRKFPGKLPNYSYTQYLQMRSRVLDGMEDIPEPERAHLVSQYDGGIANIDLHLGRLVERLQRMGLYENTLIIITSDHGEAFGERGFVEHGVASLYRDQVHVPLVIKYPGAQGPAGKEDRFVSQVDLLPTVLDVIGEKMPAHLQGNSLIGSASGHTDGSVFSEAFPTGLLRRFRRLKRSVVLNGMKFIGESDGAKEMYDLRQDPNELRNLCGSRPASCSALEARLDEWSRLAPKKLEEGGKLKRESLDRLKSLGYIQ